MNPDEQRIAIAEACGWKRHPRDPWIVTAPNMPNSVQPLSTIPDYLNDLNAMHQAWLTLSHFNRDCFESALYSVIVGQAEYNRNDDQPYITNATALQRARAFLETLGLWEGES